MPLTHPVLQNPLVILDWTSCELGDCVPIKPAHKTSDWNAEGGNKVPLRRFAASPRRRFIRRFIRRFAASRLPGPGRMHCCVVDS